MRVMILVRRLDTLRNLDHHLSNMFLRLEIHIRVEGFIKREHLVNNWTGDFWISIHHAYHVLESEKYQRMYESRYRQSPLIHRTDEDSPQCHGSTNDIHR